MEFYRYQSINKLTLQNLSNQQNWVADPLEFNDPFEFSLYDNYLLDEKGNAKYFTHIEHTNVMKYKDLINNYGVICYSSNNHNTLLWSHYADHHKGMCLVFDLDEENIKKLYKVNYQKNFAEINYTDDSQIMDEIKKLVTTKSIEWEYENEYRQIFIEKNTLFEYPGKLVEIIFGCRTPFEDIKMVTNIAISKNPNILISKMHMDSAQYSLCKVSLGDNTKIPNIWNNRIRI